MKRILMILTVAMTSALAFAQQQYATISMASGVWNTAMNQQQFYWWPDHGQSFQARVFENYWNGQRWAYTPTATLGLGSSYQFYDNSSYASGVPHAMEQDVCFLLMWFPGAYSPGPYVESYNYAMAHGWLPEGWGSIDSWTGTGWSSTVFGADTWSWQLWVCRFDKYHGTSSASLIDAGHYAPPSNVSAYETTYGQH